MNQRNRKIYFVSRDKANLDKKLDLIEAISKGIARKIVRNKCKKREFGGHC